MTSEKPASFRYVLPPEWARHKGTWMSWPKDPITFPAGVIEKVEVAYATMISALLEKEKVFLLVNNMASEGVVRSKLEKSGVNPDKVSFRRIRSVDVWTRDYAPVFVKRFAWVAAGVAAVKWIYNAYGEKYKDLLPDNQTGGAIASSAGLPVFRPRMVLEGGSIDTNGRGTLLTTEQCLLNKNRNPNLNREQIEARLKAYFGIERVVWLGDGIEGDDTDGHVDDISRFIGTNTVVTAVEKNKADKNYAPLKRNLELLTEAGFELVKLPMPHRIDVPNRRLPASYANFYLANGVVLMPAFGDKRDRLAKETLDSCFPQREIVPIPHSKALVFGYGGVHCATMQQPA